MLRRIFILGFLAVLAPSVAQAQPTTSQGSGDTEKGTYLGVLFSAVPQPLYAQVPTLRRDYGVVVNFVLPDSPAAKAGLQRYDILLEYDNTPIKDCDQFAELIRADKPDRSIKLSYLRGGKEQSTQAKLELGPALKVTEKTNRDPDKTYDVPKGVGKPAPGGVTVSVKPLDGGLVTVLVEYLDDKSGELHSIPLQRKTLTEVDDEIVKLPTRIQPLAKSAWKQVREKLEQKSEDKK
jgi:membrane-associated protease RseP (regulator of RpoE activity)